MAMLLTDAIQHATDVANQHKELAMLLSELWAYKNGFPLGSNVPVECDLDAIIKSCREKESCDCTECGREHGQIAGWLEELKSFRTKGRL